MLYFYIFTHHISTPTTRNASASAHLTTLLPLITYTHYIAQCVSGAHLTISHFSYNALCVSGAHLTISHFSYNALCVSERSPHYNISIHYAPTSNNITQRSLKKCDQQGELEGNVVKLALNRKSSCFI